jgi:membrane protease YdiL (CAAX protease family)
MKLTRQNTIPQCFAIGFLFQTLLIALTAIGISLLIVPTPKWVALINLGAMTITAATVFVSLLIAQAKNYMLPRHYLIFIIAALALLATAIGLMWHYNVIDITMLYVTLLLTVVQPLYEGVLFRGMMWHKIKKIFNYNWRTWLIHLAVVTVCQLFYAYGIYQLILSNGSELVDPMNIILVLLLYGVVYNAILGGLRCLTHNFMTTTIVHCWLNLAMLYFVLL